MELSVLENLYLGAYIYNDKVGIERTLCVQGFCILSKTIGKKRSTCFD